MVGASGAIAGVLAAYGSLYPRSPITVVNPIPLLWLFFGIFIELPAWVVILEFFLVNLWYGLGAVGDGTPSRDFGRVVYQLGKKPTTSMTFYMQSSQEAIKRLSKTVCPKQWQF